MPKIAIDVSPLNNGNSVRGVGRYTKNLVSSLQAEIATNSKYADWQVSEITSYQLPVTSYDLVHYPYFDPFFLTLPVQKKIPFIVTVHDLMPREFKSHFPVGLKGEIKWLIQRHRLRQANYIITDSHYSKHVIKDLVNYPEDQIYPIWLAAEPTYQPIKDKARLTTVQKKYHLPPKFILYVGDINWNKNVPSLVKVCLELNYPLVIVGSAAVRPNVEAHPWNQDLLWLQNQTSPLIIRPGFVPDEDLACFYNLATCYCQPSFAEGFGLNVVEAMQSGCPVAYAAATSMVETMDYQGLFFNPNSLSEIKKSLSDFWTSPALAQKYSRLGLKRAKVFNWHFTALQTLAVYELALNHARK